MGYQVGGKCWVSLCSLENSYSIIFMFVCVLLLSLLLLHIWERVSLLEFTYFIKSRG